MALSDSDRNVVIDDLANSKLKSKVRHPRPSPRQRLLLSYRQRPIDVGTDSPSYALRGSVRVFARRR